MTCACCGEPTEDFYRLSPTTGWILKDRVYCALCFETIHRRALRDELLRVGRCADGRARRAKAKD